MNNNPKQKIALIAGNGHFPLEFSNCAKARAYHLLTVAVDNEPTADLEKLADDYYQLKLGELGKLLKLLKQHEIKQVAFAGGIRKTKLFDQIAFDIPALAVLAKARSLKDDVILRHVADEIENNGIEVISAASFLEQSVPQAGVLSKRRLSKQEQTDAEIGFEAAKGVGALDIGQSVVVYKGVVVSVEAADGTDANIIRSESVTGTDSQTKAGEGAVLVKVSKPQQDLRFDLPSIGPKTIENCKQSGVTAIVIEADKSLIIDREKVLELVDSYEIALLSKKSGNS